MKRVDPGLTGVAAEVAAPVAAPGDVGAALLAALSRERRAQEALQRAEWELQAASAQVAAGRAAMRAAAMAELVERAGRARDVTAREADALAEVARQAEVRLAGRAAEAPATVVPQARVERVWDPVVRVFHWGVAGAFLANAFMTEPGKTMHLWIGYGVAALVLLRVVWGFIGTRHARFADFVPGLTAVRRQLTEMAGWQRVAHAGHSPLGALMILNLLASLAGVVVSGHMLTTVAYFGVGWVETLHESLVLWIKVSVALHVLAVLVESARTGVNLAAAMITGRKRLG